MSESVTTRSCPFEKRFPSQLVKDDAFFMSLAYNQAIEAWRIDEVPIGAVIELGGEIIGSASANSGIFGAGVAVVQPRAIELTFRSGEPQ